MKSDHVYLVHIRSSIEKIFLYTDKGRDEFMADQMTQDAVIRNFEIIGEASKNISEDLKRSHPEIPWKLIGSLRDRLIHAYFGVQLELIWKTIEQDLDKLRAQIETILTNPSEADKERS